MTRRLHDDVVWLFAKQLRCDGHRVATEVGIPGGRIDVVRLDMSGEWVEFYEVKVRAPEAGLAQLTTYARYLTVPPKRTLVVPPDLATDQLRAAAKDSGARIEVFDHRLGVQLSLRDDYGRWVQLPYIHPASSARAAERNREWACRQRSEAA